MKQNSLYMLQCLLFGRSSWRPFWIFDYLKCIKSFDCSLFYNFIKKYILCWIEIPIWNIPSLKSWNGGHLGRHLEFLKMLYDASWASFWFYNSIIFRNRIAKQYLLCYLMLCLTEISQLLTGLIYYNYIRRSDI